MEVKKLSHCAYVCDYHIVIVTKYRRKIFNNGMFSYLETKVREIRKYCPVVEVIEINHDKDHIHIQISIPPTIRVGKVVRIIKSNRAREIRKKFEWLKEVYWGSEGIWSDGYFVSTVGITRKVVAEYIRKQGEEDTGQAKLVLS
jgi:putative transposase